MNATGESRVVLHALRLRQGRRGKDRKILNDIFGDEDKKAIVEFALEREYPDLKFDENELVFGGPIQDFLAWILENQDGLLKFIKAIMALFVAAEPKTT